MLILHFLHKRGRIGASVRPSRPPSAPPMCGEWCTNLPRRNLSRWSRRRHHKRGLYRFRGRRRDERLQPPHPYRTRKLPNGTAVAAPLRTRPPMRPSERSRPCARACLWMCWGARCCTHRGRWQGACARWQWAFYMTSSGLHCSTNSIRLPALSAEVEIAAHGASEPILG